MNWMPEKIRGYNGGKRLIKTVDYQGTLKTYTSVFDTVKNELKEFHDKVIDTRLAALVRTTTKTISTEAERIKLLGKLSSHLEDIRKDITTYLGKNTNKYLNLPAVKMNRVFVITSHSARPTCV